MRTTKFEIGQIVNHRAYPFQDVICDVDPEFSIAEE